MRHLLILAALLSTPVYAQQTCMGREDQIAYLKEKYGETLSVTAVGDVSAVELYSNSDTGTWTITRTNRSGTMCLLEAGKHGVYFAKQGEKT